MKDKTYRGHVIKAIFAPGSKSEHEAVCLVMANGKQVRLRQLGGNPFFDPALNALVGKHIKALGELVHGNTLIMASWEELPAAATKPLP